MAVSLRSVLESDEAAVLRLVLDAVSDCLIVVDTEGRVVFINKPYCELLGADSEDLLDRHVRDVVSPASHLAEVAQGSAPRPSTRLMVRGREILTRQVPITINGEIVGALGMSLFSDPAEAVSTLQQFSTSIALSSATSQWHAKYGLDDIVGQGPEMEALRQRIRQYARSPFPVLIHGETGTGKELVAQAIHRLSARSPQPFVWINCTTIPPDLVSSELFGYEGGAFTGASARGAKGKIELAHGGTLFLDEIGDMPLHAQASLLRFLQEGEITRVGGNRPIKVDVRVIGASHKSLPDLVRRGLFREDLFYRLGVLKVQVPALRERTDLDLLVSHLLSRVRHELGRPRLAISKRAVEAIKRHRWPGNVRELLATLQSAAVMLESWQFEIDQLDIPLEEPGKYEAELALAAASTSTALTAFTEEVVPLGEAVDQAERAAVAHALEQCGGNRSQAARRLGIDRTSLYKRLRAWGWDAGASS